MLPVTVSALLPRLCLLGNPCSRLRFDVSHFASDKMRPDFSIVRRSFVFPFSLLLLPLRSMKLLRKIKKKKKKKKSKMKIQKEGIYLLTPRLHLWQFTSAVTFQDWSSHNSTFHRIWFFFLCHPTISRLFTRLLVATHAFFSNIQRKDSWDIDGSSGTSSSAHRFWSAPVVTKSSPYLVLV